MKGITTRAEAEADFNARIDALECAPTPPPPVTHLLVPSREAAEPIAWRPFRSVDGFDCFVDGSFRASVELRRDHAPFPQGVYEYGGERLEPGYIGGGWKSGFTLDLAEAFRTAHMIAAMWIAVPREGCWSWLEAHLAAVTDKD